jgi:hypothetical protein
MAFGAQLLMPQGLDLLGKLSGPPLETGLHIADANGICISLAPMREPSPWHNILACMRHLIQAVIARRIPVAAHQ